MTLCRAPIRNKVDELRIISTTLGVISAVVVLVRIFYKVFYSLAELGLDDYVILATLILGVPSTIINDRGTAANGLGKDIWTVPFAQVTRFIEWFYVIEVLYFTQLALLKLSLLFFFKRIFPGPAINKIIWGTITFDILFGIAFTVAAIFQCKPISYYWTLWDGEHKGTCININALGWSNAAISIALDAWMLFIPLSQLVHLKLALNKKIGVALMFCVGTFVTVVSILRLQSLVHFANSSNPTWDQWAVALWSDVEINVGIICACMPAMRVILVRIFPKALGTSAIATDQHYAKYGTHSRVTGKGTNNGFGMSSQIMHTKTFEVRHGQRDIENGDEIGLVDMDDLSGKGRSRRNSGSAFSL
ncbi:hypothetical protein P154DRAFT_229714 [Amniculicola lignicola CBS 123094]|uniref:Rhodopsin domain-containing protein n=1 Tax=Amniculicola lignicola CBS 123094 TaxID=1392246 RepID=A0A6A5WJQ7_9PLEO|nr:hypothetical protein P154DRAFT_229714 [Amniculicola lignicola CBS 123094]